MNLILDNLILEIIQLAILIYAKENVKVTRDIYINLIDNMSFTVLGKVVDYKQEYSPKLLQMVERESTRKSLTAHEMHGGDLWIAYEVMCKYENNLYESCILRFFYLSDSKYIVESKSLKLYLFSLRHLKFETMQDLEELIEYDIDEALGNDNAYVALTPLSKFEYDLHDDNNDSENIILLDKYHFEAKNCKFSFDSRLNFIEASDEIVNESFITHSFTSNCPVTNQPDFASVKIEYRGRKVDLAKFRAYLLCFSEHHGFHEYCIEQIYCDLLDICNPEYLTVIGNYTRRGGIEINPYRSNSNEYVYEHRRVLRQ